MGAGHVLGRSALFARSPRALHVPSYATRHTYISLALTYGAKLKAVAEHCGTSVAIIEQRYGKYLGGEEGDPLTAALARGQMTEHGHQPATVAEDSAPANYQVRESEGQIERPRRDLYAILP